PRVRPPGQLCPQRLALLHPDLAPHPDDLGQLRLPVRDPRPPGRQLGVGPVAVGRGAGLVRRQRRLPAVELRPEAVQVALPAPARPTRGPAPPGRRPCGPRRPATPGGRRRAWRPARPAPPARRPGRRRVGPAPPGPRPPPSSPAPTPARGTEGAPSTRRPCG